MSFFRTTINVVERDEEQWLEINGDLDVDGGESLHQALESCLQGGARSVVIDLSEAAFVDSSGLSALLSAGRSAQLANVSLRIFAPADHQARHLINVTTGTGGLLRVVPDEPAGDV